MRLRAAAIAFAIATSACSSAADEATPPTAAAPSTDTAPATAIDESLSEREGEEELPNPGESEVRAPVAGDDASCDAAEATTVSRTDVRADGNRLHPGSLDLATATPTTVDLPAAAEWVVADPAVAGGWYVSLADGRAVRVDETGLVSEAGAAPDGPPELRADGEARSPYADLALFDDPLPDSRVVRAGNLAVALAGPTDRYAHAVLGDAIEASAIVWADLCTNERGRIVVDDADVIEGIAPLLADIDGDTELEVLVTLSNSSDGARLAAWELNGTFLAESAPIGRGNRWRNQLAVGPFGPGGEIEVVDVRTPHIGGTVQAFRLASTSDGLMLERVAASDDRYTTHVIGSRNLDLGIAVDGSGDGVLDVLVPTSDRFTVVALTRTEASGGWESVAVLPLPAQLSSNLAVQDVQGRTTLAMGTGDALLIVG